MKINSNSVPYKLLSLRSFNFSSYSKENLYCIHVYIYLTWILWPRHSQRSGEIDAVEGIALANGKWGQGPPVSHLWSYIAFLCKYSSDKRQVYKNNCKLDVYLKELNDSRTRIELPV